MAKKKIKTQKRRTKVQDLSRKKEITAEEAKETKGGELSDGKSQLTVFHYPNPVIG
ncbi:MAG TPA: hypothetical protein VFC63_06590 [Blastocatellia bacterium]|nr:hypothetical protein [Blastocatellia bacterium]